jgi:hypothetical protein
MRLSVLDENSKEQFLKERPHPNFNSSLNSREEIYNLLSFTTEV